MCKQSFPGILCLLLLTNWSLTSAEDNFEDNNQDIDFLSAGKNSNFDLRHTIPGEPGVDYPIYHEVPETSFLCAGRHEGYYADTESRCQAFHICTHTARSSHGFGFLCPNGTLFSQKNFVCDWYRNVNCDESSRYFSKNNANRVGSNRDMMETVRQMIEYPMRTITKALQNVSTSNKGPTNAKQTIKKALDEAVIPLNSATQNVPIQKKPVTRAEGERAYSYGNAIAAQPVYNNAVSKAQRSATEAVPIVQPQDDVEESNKQSEETGYNDVAIDVSGEDIYVNSLGELSTDPGVEFNHTNAHVIAEYPRKYHSNKHLNFAAKINAGLNNVIDVPSLDVLAPDYIKRIRMTKEEAVQHDLISNINGLLEEVSIDVDPKRSGYKAPSPPKKKQTFRFLSRGFESNERTGRTTSYVYKKPQQTASTVSFSPSSIPTETHPNTQYIDTHTSEVVRELNTLEAATAESAAMLETSANEQAFAANLAAATINAETNDQPKFEALILTTTEAPIADPAEDNSLNEAEAESERQTALDINDLVSSEEKTDVNKHAENLFVAGVQLSQLGNQTESIQQVIESTPIAYVNTASQNNDVGALILQIVQDAVNSPNATAPPAATIVTESTTTESTTSTTSTTERTTTTPEPSTTPEPTTSVSPTAMRTSTETITEVNSTQERLRGYRRFSNFQRGSTNKPLIYAKRANVRAIPSRTRTTSTTTTKPNLSTTPLSYLKRVAASRLRLAKLTAGKNVKADDSTNTETSLNVSTTKTLNKEARKTAKRLTTPTATATTTTATQSSESVQNNWQRLQLSRRKRPSQATTATAQTTTTIRPQARTTAARIPARSQHRFGNLKTQTARGSLYKSALTANAINPIRSPATKAPPSPPTSASASTSTTPTPPQSSTNTVYTKSPISNNAHETHIDLNSILNSLTVSPIANANRAALPTVASTKPATNAVPIVDTSLSAQYSSIDKLRRSIVDDSILQNFQSNAASRSYQNSYNDGKYNRDYINKAAAPSREKDFNEGPSSLAAPKPQFPQIQIPGIVIARAEGQRIAPNSVGNVISSLVTQKPPTTQTQSAAYVPLNDFLTNKFGYNAPVAPKTTAATYFGQQQPQQQKYQQLQSQPQQLQFSQQQKYPQQQASTQQQVVQFKQQQPQQQQPQQQQRPLSNYQAQKNPFFAPTYESHQYTQHHTAPQTMQQQQQQSYNQRTQNPFIDVANKQAAQIQQQKQQSQYQQYQQPQYQQQQQPKQQFNQLRQQPQPPQQQLRYQTPLQGTQTLQQQQQQQQPQYQTQYQIQPNQLQQYQAQSTQNQYHTQALPQLHAPPLEQQRELKNVFANYQQHQQQLPQFPPLSTSPNAQNSLQGPAAAGYTSNTYPQSNNNYLNVQLPSAPAGLIPAPTTQVAQKRSDDAPAEEHPLTLADNVFNSFVGASSYDVPLSSIGRLPNDITDILRRRLRKY